MEELLAFLAGLGIDWGTLWLPLGTYALVWLSNKSGIAKSGNAKRFSGAVVGMSLAMLRLTLMESVPATEYEAQAVILVNWLIGWLGSALGHTGVEVAQAGLKARKQLQPPVA